MDTCEIMDYAESYPPGNFSWFVEGRVAAMACPENVAHLNYLIFNGVNHLVSLSPETMPPVVYCEFIKRTAILVEDFDAPTMGQIADFMDICVTAPSKGEVVGVHCRQGRGRTGTMLACYLVHVERMTPETAIDTVRALRPGSLESYEQLDAVQDYYNYLRQKEK